MARKKHIKLAEVKTFPNVFEFEDAPLDKPIREYFGNDNPVVLEVGCGHGDYTVNLAKHFPDKNFIGLDLRPARLWVGAKLSLDEEISNAAFLATRAERLPEILKEEKISEIYIPFPEPHVRRRCEKRRLVSDFFLNIYKQVMVENGIIIFKTDDDGLYEYSVKVLSEMEATIIENDPDLYSTEELHEAKQIQTTYEKYYIENERTIKYMKFTLPSN